MSIEIETKQPVQKTIIWLHGLGADGNDFVPVVDQLSISKKIGIRFIFPHAPIIPVTINAGYEMRAWFDIYDLNSVDRLDIKGINASITFVERLIEQELKRQVASQDIILAGFSQGSLIALLAGLNASKPLGGIICLSGLLPMMSQDIVSLVQSSQHKNIPIFMAHGREDTVIPYQLGEFAYQALKMKGYQLTWHLYDMPHSVCDAELRDLDKWLETIWDPNK